MPVERDYIGANTSTVVLGEGVEAFLAIPKPDGHGPYPAVILGHERYGLVKHTLDLAARFASYGYVCIAPDMASLWDGDKEALSRGDARLTLTEDQIKFYMAKSLDYLQAQSYVENSRIAAMGVCQSGAYPLLLNSIRSDICANLVFYGGTATSQEVIDRLSAPVLGVWGELDHTISTEHVAELRGRLEAGKKSYDFKLFPGGPHGWLNDTMPGRYRQRLAEDAWAYMISFLEGVHAGEYPKDRVRWRSESDISKDYDFSKNVRLE